MSALRQAQDERKPRCYVCGSVEIAADADLRSPTCEECKPARDHVVSMQTAPGGGSLAVCPCGWRSIVNGRLSLKIQDVQVKLHWRAMIAIAADAARMTGGVA